ncbi:deoxyribose-phosphate aldolase [Halocatena salina]|uniref:Deoxyribose-phosphate aldolase n=1 Tax=Halocatena salina TaxID=2934340 RepID=A0A8U0A4G9_9EURY|nr:deoxyribose-phosphate aldolase [Halocatena salina]UPM43358.1 deoxyribose-phosphate aldolase [Halocatena salina]
MDDFPARIDHTVLGVDTTAADAKRVVRDAERYGMNACIPPCYVPTVETDVVLTTVIGFPHGQHTPETKRVEAQQAYSNGCDELDMVINVGRLKAGADEALVADIETVVDAVPIPVKAIIETAVLEPEEKHRACELAAAAGADFVKTSTGFADGGATVDDVALMSEYLPVKASGGIGSYDRANALLEAGAERIGASSGVQLVKEYRTVNDRT